MKSVALRSVLVATDLSAAGEVALQAGIALAQHCHAELHAIHALDIPVVPYLYEHFPAAALRRQVMEAEDRLEDQVRSLCPTGFEPASCAVFLSAPHRAILERVAVAKADVVILGPHRERLIGDRFLGTTADRVMHEATVPCLIVREPLALPLRRIVAPLDLSTSASIGLECALRWVAQLGADSSAIGLPDAEVRVVHVIPRVFQNKDFPFDRAVIGPELSREVAAAVARTGAAGSATVHEEVLWGDLPADDLVRYASQHDTQLLVVSTHGAGTLRRAVIGSVASGIARAAPCAVLLVPSVQREAASNRRPAARAVTVPVGVAAPAGA